MSTWTDEAACAGMWALFDRAKDGADNAAVREAVSVCAGCQVWRECLTEAMAAGEAGVWGGTTAYTPAPCTAAPGTGPAASHACTSPRPDPPRAPLPANNQPQPPEVDMALCPFATRKLIAPGSSDPRITARAVVLHVDAGGAASLFDFFRDRSGGVESHFHITWTGTIEQYRDTGYQADANYRANDFAISIETQGFGGGTWNKRQIASIGRLLLWLHETHGIPLEEILTWDGTGVGYHVQFGAPGPWTPVAKSCPGPNRITQYDTVIVPWMRQQSAGPPTRGPLVDHALADLTERRRKAKDPTVRRALRRAKLELKALKTWRKRR